MVEIKVKKLFNNILATVAAAGIVAIPATLWHMSNEQAKTNERLVRIETKLGITIAKN